MTSPYEGRHGCRDLAAGRRSLRQRCADLASGVRVASIGIVAVLALAACGGGDPGPSTIPPADGPGAAPTTSAPPAGEAGDDAEARSNGLRSASDTPAPTTPTPTVPPGPNLAERLDSIEVSALWTAGEGVLSVAADESLVSVTVPSGETGRLGLAARCSPVDGLAPGTSDGLVVRVVEPAVDRRAGGLEGFELVATAPVAGAVVAPTEASIRVEIDGESIASSAATVIVDEDPATGSFRGELPDGSVIEGAYRCA